MTTYNRLAVEQIFDEIWDNWINKDGESAARKAVDVFLKSGNSKSDLLKACESYRLDVLGSDPEFTYKLSNFLNQDHWKDVLENVSLTKLQARHDEAIAVIQAWNDACLKHWCKVSDIENRVPLATKALNNKAFKDGWETALELAKNVFKYSFSDEDYRSKIILSFKWFTNVASDKHTVLRLIEGEYGEAKFSRTSTYKTVPTKVITPEERARLIADYQEVFNNKTNENIINDRESQASNNSGTTDPFDFV